MDAVRGSRAGCAWGRGVGAGAAWRRWGKGAGGGSVASFGFGNEVVHFALSIDSEYHALQTVTGLSAGEPKGLGVVRHREGDFEQVAIVFRVELIEASVEHAVRCAGRVEVGLSECVVLGQEGEDDDVVFLDVLEAVGLVDVFASCADCHGEGLVGRRS